MSQNKLALEIKVLINRYIEPYNDIDLLISSLAQYTENKIREAVSTSTSTSTSKGNDYALFIKHAHAALKRKDEYNIMVKPTSNFRSTESQRTFETNQTLMSLLGKELTFADLIEKINTETRNMLKTCGIAWGLLGNDERTTILLQ